MTRRALTRSSRAAVATGAMAAGAVSLGAAALGAVALGAIAVGALAIGRLTVGRARFRRVEIRELSVDHITIGSVGMGDKLTILARIRAETGKGDMLERLLGEQRAGQQSPSFRAYRSPIDPDQFLFSQSYDTAVAFERHSQTPRFMDFLRHAAEQGLLVAPFADDPVNVELYRAL